MQITVAQIGNSQGIIIPKQILTEIGLKKGSKLYIEKGADGKSLVLSKHGSKSTSITPDFVKVLNGVNKRYGLALSKLAKL